jgi:hypothetical protein
MNPQEIWQTVIDHIAGSSNEAPIAIRSHVAKICELKNVPRNKKKFINFVKNSIKIYNDAVIENIWSYIESVKVEQFGQQQNENESTKDNDDNMISNNSVQKEEIEVVEVNKDEVKEKVKKEKKKKRKKEECDTADVIESVEVEEAEVSKEKKHKKKKKSKTDELECS